MRLVILIALLLFEQVTFGQKKLDQLINNNKFEWLADSTSTQLTIYYQADSWISENITDVYHRVINRIESTKSFIGVNSYDSRIYLFIVDNREQMNELINRQTNGAAFPKHNIMTGIASNKVNSIYSNHEIFHIIAMNLWGASEIWINEGMAVYSDQYWRNIELYQLTKYLVDNNRYVPLKKLIKKFKSVDTLTSYPLAGSFMKYLDKTYGREIVIKLWKTNSKNLKKITGKSIDDLEKDWLLKVQEVDYGEIKY
jgi:hypothetical protein